MRRVSRPPTCKLRGNNLSVAVIKCFSDYIVPLRKSQTGIDLDPYFIQHVPLAVRHHQEPACYFLLVTRPPLGIPLLAVPPLALSMCPLVIRPAVSNEYLMHVCSEATIVRDVVTVFEPVPARPGPLSVALPSFLLLSQC